MAALLEESDRNSVFPQMKKRNPSGEKKELKNSFKRLMNIEGGKSSRKKIRNELNRTDMIRAGMSSLRLALTTKDIANVSTLRDAGVEEVEIMKKLRRKNKLKLKVNRSPEEKREIRNSFKLKRSIP